MVKEKPVANEGDLKALEVLMQAQLAEGQALTLEEVAQTQLLLQGELADIKSQLGVMVAHLASIDRHLLQVRVVGVPAMGLPPTPAGWTGLHMVTDGTTSPSVEAEEASNDGA